MQQELVLHDAEEEDEEEEFKEQVIPLDEDDE